MSEIATMCYICRRKLATRICRLCGKAVCDDDYDGKAGLCNNCKSGRVL